MALKLDGQDLVKNGSKTELKVAIPLGWILVYLFHITFFHFIKLFVGIVTTELQHSNLQVEPSIFGSDQASVVIRLVLWP